MTPQADRDVTRLRPAFRVLVEAMLADLAQRGTPFRPSEGFRSLERQQYLYALGRSLPGGIVTRCDGVRDRSLHQDGLALDAYPVGSDGRVYLPPATDPVWDRYAEAAERQGLIAGRRWRRPDSPHVEMPG